MHNKQIALFIALAGLLALLGCLSPKPPPDPLAGWRYLEHVGHSHFDKAVTEDYWDYVHKLPDRERRAVDEYSISEFENASGQHAVRIEVPLRGTYWEHVLIYDRSNIRIKTIKYEGGRYRS